MHGSLMGALDGGKCPHRMEHTQGVLGTGPLAAGRYHAEAGYDFFEHHV